jgi:hypothetical protein
MAIAGLPPQDQIAHHSLVLLRLLISGPCNYLALAKHQCRQCAVGRAVSFGLVRS